MGIPGQLSIRTIKVSDQERCIVAELHPSDGLGNQRMQQFRASVHFDAAIKDQAELVLVVEHGPINDSLLRIGGVANPIKERDLPLLKLRAGNWLTGASCCV